MIVARMATTMSCHGDHPPARFARVLQCSHADSQDDGGECGVWRRVRILKSLVFSLSTTVRGTRGSLREADQTFSARLRIVGAVSDNGTSCSKVSSAEIDFVGLSGTTWLLSMPRDNS